MTTVWNPAAVLPNVSVREPIDSEFVALVGQEDQRLSQILRHQPNFRKFFGRFVDAFGQKLSPSVIIVRSDTPAPLRENAAIASFRDAISIACVSQSRAREITANRPMGIKYANAFNVYPWMMDNRDKYLIGLTFAFHGIHDVNKFNGQSDPHISVSSLRDIDYDEPLLEALLVRWRTRYLSRRPSWRDIALFRSLNMAFHASLLPGGSDAVFHDVGRIIAVWVSALEILAHPGPGARSNLATVYGLLEESDYIYRQSKYRRYSSYESGRPKRKRLIAAWLYGQLFQARNSFLHGNEVSLKTLRSHGSHAPGLFLLAAVLYRVALASFLDLDSIVTLPPNADADAIAAAVARHSEFRTPQRYIERALLKSRGIDPHERRRRP